MKTYTDIMFCDHCQRDTDHIVQDNEHERDSSDDIETCTVCRWYRSGYDGKCHAPSFEYTESLATTTHPIQNMLEEQIIDVSNVSDDQLMHLIRFFDRMLQDKGRSYKSMVPDVRKYVSGTI